MKNDLKTLNYILLKTSKQESSKGESTEGNVRGGGWEK